MSAAQPADVLNYQTTDARRAAIRESVTAGAALTRPYLAMNVGAAFIAGSPRHDSQLVERLSI